MTTLEIVEIAEKVGITSAPCAVTWTQLVKFAELIIEHEIAAKAKEDN